MTALEAKTRLVSMLVKYVPGPELHDAAALVEEIEESSYLEGQAANDAAWKQGTAEGLIRLTGVAS